MTKLEFNGKVYTIVRGKDGGYSITRGDGKALGYSAAMQGAIYACTLDAFRAKGD